MDRDPSSTTTSAPAGVASPPPPGLPASAPAGMAEPAPPGLMLSASSGAGYPTPVGAGFPASAGAAFPAPGGAKFGHGALRPTPDPRLAAAAEELVRAIHEAGRLNPLYTTLLALVRRDGRDLTARQLTAFMTVYLDVPVHTVSSMAEVLNVSRPGVTRILDRLAEYDLIAREEDRDDRRRVLIRRTARGVAFLREIEEVARGATQAAP